jgi:anti-sigma factor RsiW
MLLRRRRALVCREAVTMVTDYLEEALSPRDRTRLEAHLAGCANCSEYLAQIQATIAAAGHVEPDDLAPEALDELVSLYRHWRAG